MEYGLIPNIDQFRENKATLIAQVNASSASSEIGQRNKLQDVEKQEFLNKADENSEVSEVKIDIKQPQFEYTLTNTNFGFNNSSRDFFVKAQRGDFENQYPTEEMMKLKAYMLQQNQIGS